MKVFGTGTVGAPVDAVWAALADPDLLRRAIPGCERLDVTGPGRCELTVATAIAAVAGTYSGEAEIRERQGPGLLLVAKVSAAGGRGGVAADVTVRLTPASDGATELGYDIEAQVDGAIAGVGQLVLASVARRLAGEFIGGLAGPAGDAPPAEDGLPAAGEPPDGGAIARARSGIGRRGEFAAGPVRPRPGSRPGWSRTGPGQGVGTGLVAGAAVGLAGILIGAVLGRRRGRPGGSR